MRKLTQFFCRHRYSEMNLWVSYNKCTYTVKIRNYCVKCGKRIEMEIPLERLLLVLKGGAE